MRSMKSGLLVFALLAFAFASMPIVFAASTMNMDFDIADMFTMVFGPKGLGGILQSTYGVYGATLILYYLLLFSIFSTALKRVKMFEGEGGTGLSTSGKLLAHAFTGLATLGVFAYLDPTRYNMFSMLGSFGWFGQLLMIIVVFMLVYRMLGSDR